MFATLVASIQFGLLTVAELFQILQCRYRCVGIIVSNRFLYSTDVLQHAFKPFCTLQYITMNFLCTFATCSLC